MPTVISTYFVTFYEPGLSVQLRERVGRARKHERRGRRPGPEGHVATARIVPVDLTSVRSSEKDTGR